LRQCAGPPDVIADDAGQALVEAIIVVCVLVGLLASVMLLGRAGTTHQQVCFAARRAAFGSEPLANQKLEVPTLPARGIPPNPLLPHYDDGGVTVELYETWAGDFTGDELTKCFFDEEGTDRKYSGVIYQHINASVVRDRNILVRKNRIVAAWKPVIGRTISGDRGFLAKLTLSLRAEYEVACDPWSYEEKSAGLVSLVYVGCGLLSSFNNEPFEQDPKGFFNLCLVPELPEINIEDWQAKVIAKVGDVVVDVLTDVVRHAVDEAIGKLPWPINDCVRPIITHWLDPYITGFAQKVTELLPP